MEIINKKVLEDLDNNKLLSLNLGSGYEKKGDFYNLDINEGLGVDIVADLNLHLDKLPNNSVSKI